MRNLITIDWLELYALAPEGELSDRLEAAGCSVKLREYGTRIYNNVAFVTDWELDTDFEVRYWPKSSAIMPPNACHIKISNAGCYLRHPGITIWAFLQKHKFQYVSVARCDICYDFVTFDSGIKPSDFMTRVIRGSYKRSRKGLRKDIIQEDWSNSTPNYISWKSGDIMVRIYDKTLELTQEASAEKRSYISALWVQEGIIENASDLYDQAKPHVYRLEFQISSSTKNWVDVASGQFFESCIDTYCSGSETSALFRALVAEHFTFMVYKDKSDIASCQEVRLFSGIPSMELRQVSKDSIRKADSQMRLLAMMSRIDKCLADPQSKQWSDTLREIRNDMARVLHDNNISDEQIAIWRQTISDNQLTIF